MNHTQSGAITVGAPMSQARFVAEAEHAMQEPYNLLLLTEEGRMILSRFAQTQGCQFDEIGDFTADWLAERDTKLGLFIFLAAMKFTFNLKP